MPIADPFADTKRAAMIRTVPRDIADEVVLDRQQASAVLGVSDDTLDRLNLKKVRISERCVGYTMGEIRSYQKANLE
jgi:hypothetical protein